MANQIEREAWVKQDKLKNPIHYVRGTDLLPIVFHFRDFSIPSGATARVFVAKPDGNAVYTTATIDGNDVTVDVTDQMFIELGTALMQISIMDGEEELVSFVQPVDVQQNLKAGDLPASTTDVKFLDEAIEQANEAVNTATTAAKQAATAVQNANQAIEDANAAIRDLNAQMASLNTNFASLANNVRISQLDTTAKTLVGAIDELNSKSLFGSVTHTSHKKQLSSESDYVTLAEMSANTNSIIIVKTQWITGKPVGLRIIDKTTQTPYAIVEDAESGYLNLFFSPNTTTGAYTLQIQEKNLNPNGLSGIDVIEIQFNF